MKKIEIDSDVFCMSQQKAVLKMHNLHLITIKGVKNLEDPVTDRKVGYRLLIEMPAVFRNIYALVLTTSIDQEGKEHIERLINRGLIKTG